MKELLFFVGLLIGWVVGYLFWPGRRQKNKEAELALQNKLADAENKIRNLESQLTHYRQQEEQLKTCNTQLETKTEELQSLHAKIASAEDQIEALREQLTAAETKVQTISEQKSRELQDVNEKFASAEQQIETLREQLAAAEAKCQADLDQKTREVQDLSAKAASAEEQIEALREQLKAAQATPRTVAESVPSDPHQAATLAIQTDDLRKIEGIGPKVAQILNDSGILTFEQLAQTEVDRLRSILEEAGPPFKGMEPESWPEQARLAANGEWETLKTLQDQLDGGRYKS